MVPYISELLSLAKRVCMPFRFSLTSFLTSSSRLKLSYLPPRFAKTMSTGVLKTVAVLGYDEIQDGEMCVEYT